MELIFATGNAGKVREAQQICDRLAKKWGITLTIVPMPDKVDIPETGDSYEENALQKARFDLSKFDTLYVGYPVMFGTFAPPLYTFLDSNELSGKYLVPFCTYGSGGRKSSSRELARLASNARSLLSFGISKRRVLSPNTDLTKEIRNFLNLVRAGIQEEERLASFGDSQELSGKDSSVFASAVKEYAYLNLQPIRVAKDSAGTGFLFSCRMRAFGAEENVTVQVFKSLSENGEAELIAVEK